ncbi:MAG TPA: hypothetical protein VMG35_26480 [Bryobacteraceae bacterium]|nr:hypothetical protein [Bryobacteraceae bacterium]
MTQQGGELERGVFYGLDNGLQPFVALQFPVGKAGSTLGLFGQGFTGATNVSFNGATTGYVTVTGSTGTASSSAKFYVRP